MATTSFTPTPPEVLRASLERHNATFESLLRLIPARYYLVHEESEEQAASRYQKHKKQKAPKQALKEASKKAKREKLDPANHKTVLELQAEALAAREELAPEHIKKDAKGKGKQKAAPVPVSHDDDDDNDDAEDDAAMDVDADAAFDDAAASGSGSDADDDADDVAAPDTSTPLVPMAPASDVAALRAKLHARMASLRRGGPRAWPAAGREPASRDELLDERRLQRAEMRERRRRETREKVRAQEEARGKGKSKGKEEAREAAKKGNASQAQLLVPDVSTKPDARAKLTNVAFSTVKTDDPSSSKRPHSKFLATSSNPAQALAQLQAKRARLEALPAEKREAAEERDRWAAAEARMEGTKVRDDEARLRKAAKRQDKEKVRSKKQWAERKEQLDASMAARQKKRTDNIAMRHEKRKEKAGGGKGAKAKPKGKGRPGFEGKTFGAGKQKVGKK